MSINQLRRLELKEQSLSLEINQSKELLSSLSASLKHAQAASKAIENNWQFHLAKATREGRASSLLEKQFMLTHNLSKLKKLNKNLACKKSVELQHLDKLQKAIVKSKQTQKKLQFCKEEQKLLVSKKEDLRAQSELDQLVNCKYIQRVTDNTDSSIKESDKILDRDHSFNLEIVDSYKKDITEQIVNNILELTSTQTLTIQHNPQTPVSFAAKNSTDSQSKNGLWQQAEADRQILENSNQKIQTTYLQNEQGAQLAVDYLVKPGQLLSLLAQQSVATGSKSIQISTTNSRDRDNLLTEIGSLERLSKAKVSIL